MGCVSSRPDDKPPSKPQAGDNSQKQKKGDSVVKLILLGPGESGKSTIFKQMKILNAGGIPEEERKSFVSVVYNTVLSQMKILVQAAHTEQCNLGDASSDAEWILTAGAVPADQWNPEIGERIARLWNQQPIKEIYSRRDKFTLLNDGAGYLFDAITRISEKGYIPTEADLLRIRIRTSGYERADYHYKGVRFHVCDVGGQRSERKHWNEVLDGATAVIFCASLSEFDQKLREDSKQWRAQETLNLWEELTNGPFTENMPIILFLNKVDLFKEKIATKSIRVFYKDYTGRDNYEESSQYILSVFKSKAGPNQEIFHHFVTAVDTNNVKLVWENVRELLVRKVTKEVTTWM